MSKTTSRAGARWRTRGAAVMAAGLGMLVTAAVPVAGPAAPAPAIVVLKASALKDAKPETIQDEPYWTVKAGHGARASGVSAFASADRRFDAGVSQYERVTLELRDWPIDEFMYILEGRVEITEANGRSRIFGPGDAFVVPRGFRGTWRQLSRIRKINVSYGGPFQ